MIVLKNNMEAKKALLIVDLQNDFCAGGALGIKGTGKIIPVINKYIRVFVSRGLPVLASRDWHPKKTRHFKEFGGVWPVHCIQNTKGAAFCPGLKLPKDVILLYKGMDPKKDSYSAFHAQDKKGKALFSVLKKLGVEELYIAGLATDYCVKFTAHDALKRRFRVNILSDAIKGVNLKPDDSGKATRQVARLGARQITIGKVLYVRS